MGRGSGRGETDLGDVVLDDRRGSGPAVAVEGVDCRGEVTLLLRGDAHVLEECHQSLVGRRGWWVGDGEGDILP